MKFSLTLPMRCRQAAALLLICLAGPAAAQPLPPPVQRALQAAQIPERHVAVVVQPVEAPQALIAHQPQTAFNPASVMKLVTTYAGLDLLGPAWTWKTSLWIERELRDGRLNGHLYLRGSGDPGFVIEHLWSLLRAARVRGVQQIAGDIVVDRSAFAVPETDPGAFDNQPMRPYNVGPDGLLINFRALRFTLQPGDPRPQVLQETPSDGLRIDNRLRASTQECSRDWKDQIATRLEPEGRGQRLEFSGTYSVLCGERTLNLAPLSRTAHDAGLIRALWRELGGELAGDIREGTVPTGSVRLAEYESAPLANAVRDINKFSNNVMARQLFLALGNDTAPATPERSRERIQAWLASRGLSFPELILENGAGLSRSERISAGSLNRLLLDAWRSPVMPEFIASLPIVGIDGTMKRRLTNGQATGRAHIKTGTLEGVRAAAGYALDGRGRRYAVTMLINDPRAQAGSAAIDALLLWLAQRND